MRYRFDSGSTYQSPACQTPQAFPAILGLMLGGSLLAAPSAPLGAQDAELFRVRAGSELVACGGFAGRCETRELSGTLLLDLDLEPGGTVPAHVTILGTDLELGGFFGTSEFPGPDDLQLASLSADFDGPVAELEGENEQGQRVALRLVVVPRGLGDVSNGSLALQGTYDEGCCDRFVYELGNVLLDRADDEDTVLLDGDIVDRLAVSVQWKESEGEPTDGTPVRTGSNAARFWFFEPDNPEIFVKAVPACEDAFEHHVWVFVAGLTDLGVTVTVRDLLTGQENVYQSTAGEPFVTVTDTRAFACASRLE